MAIIEVVSSGAVLLPHTYAGLTVDIPNLPTTDSDGRALSAGSSFKVLDGNGGTYLFDGTTWRAPIPQQTTITGSLTKAAGSNTASALDATITTTGFNHISLTNDDPTNNIIFALDESSIGATKPVIIKAGESFQDDLKGTILHYSASVGTPSFRYVLR